MATRRMLKMGWTVCVVAMGSLLIVLTFTKSFSLTDHVPSTVALMAIVGAMGFMAEYVDSSLGMGYGTTLTPILMILGFTPLQVVPAVLLSEFISGISAGTLHHKVGNVDLSRGTRANKTMLILAFCSVVGTVAAVLLAVSLPKQVVKTYIGVMILAIGVFILLGRFIAKRFSWGRIVALGTVASFNKGISGGGYGPLVTGGQVLVGVPEKNAIGITSFAEGLVCLVGLVLYFITQGAPVWTLALPLTIGAFLSVPAATWTVKILPERMLRQSIGYATVFLGCLTLIKVLM